ncbi:MAG: fumarylacetoacetate hydrolase family protein, partial [Gammaproteobacteria bacterium]|nr:fumarylacetoacetate hydrolase family protein [Gammaproteobacteria bacterium]
MKLLRFGEPGAERPGLLDENGVIRDLSAVIVDLDGPNLNAESLSKTADSDVSGFPTVSGDVRIGPCVGNVGKIVCVGRNYVEHAEESGSAVADEPVIFFKATSAISGPYDPVVIPRDSAKTDWEVELGVVIGTRASYVAEAEAL